MSCVCGVKKTDYHNLLGDQKWQAMATKHTHTQPQETQYNYGGTGPHCYHDQHHHRRHWQKNVVL